MTILRVRGRDLRDALERARARGGDDAVVLTQEALPDGSVSVSVSLPTDPAVLVPAPRRAEVRLKVWPDSESRDAARLELVARLRRHGASEEFARRITDLAAREGTSGILAIDSAARAIAACVPIAPSPKPRARIAFVGASGAGKSSAAGRLAMRLGRAGRKVGFVALVDDAQRIGLPFASAARALGRPIAIARERGGLAAALAERNDCDVVLVDAPGVERTRPAELVEQAALCGADELGITRYLVLSAALSVRVLADQLDATQALRPGAAVLTRFDETSEPGAAVELVARRSLGLALLSRGPLAESDLCRADGERAADLLLRGRFE